MSVDRLVHPTPPRPAPPPHIICAFELASHFLGAMQKPHLSLHLMIVFFIFYVFTFLGQMQPLGDPLRGNKFSGISDQNNTIEVDIENCVKSMMSIPSDLFIPIFVLTRDRMSSLKTALNSYQRTFNSPYEIIILDHNSTYPPMVQFLHELEFVQNLSVISLGEGTWDVALVEVRDIIQDYLGQHPGIEFYVFTDPDIAFLRTAQDVLLFYAGVLQSCPEIKIVGPSLQISDIPEFNTMKVSGQKSVFEWEKQFWNAVPSVATWNGMLFCLILCKFKLDRVRRNLSLVNFFYCCHFTDRCRVSFNSCSY